MPFLNSFLAISALEFAPGAFAGEFNNECAWGLANGQHVKTDGSVSMKNADGKTYCFSSEQAKTEFMKNVKINLAEAARTASGA